MTEYEGSDHYNENIIALYDAWDKLIEQPPFSDAGAFPAVNLRCAKNHRIVNIQMRHRDTTFGARARFNPVFDVEPTQQSAVSESHPGEGLTGQIGDTRSTFICAQCADASPGANIEVRTVTLLHKYATAVMTGKRFIKLEGNANRKGRS